MKKEKKELIKKFKVVIEDLMDNYEEYTAEDKNKFETYLQERIDKIDIPNKDESFLRTKILEMYANPLKNKLEAIKN